MCEKLSIFPFRKGGRGTGGRRGWRIKKRRKKRMEEKEDMKEEETYGREGGQR